MKILIVEDEPDAVFLFEQIFREYTSEGALSLIFASDGVEALDYLQHCVPGELPVIALVDINMPRMDGLTLLGHIMEIYPFIRVIMVTAYSDMANIRTAMNFGAFDFLIKPISPNDLKLTVNKAIWQITGEREQEQEKQVIRQKYWNGWGLVYVLFRFIGHLGNQLSNLTEDSTPTSLEATLKRCEKMTILQAVARNEGNISKAAEDLEINRRTLHRKLKELTKIGNE